jgi:DNA-binding response OmpR family regulator
VARVLIIEDDPVCVQLITRTLEARGHDVTAAADGRAGMKRFQSDDYDLVISDLVMPDQDGIETIREIRRQKPSVAIIAVSGGLTQPFGVSVDYLGAARLLGADATLKKPFMPSTLVSLVDETLDQRRDSQSGSVH